VTVSVMVFTRDLRLADNPALTAASRAGAVVPLFVWDQQILGAAGGNASRLGFLLDSLRALDAGLREVGGALVSRTGPWAKTVIETARSAGAARIHLAEDVSGYAAARLETLRRAAEGTGIACSTPPCRAGVSTRPASTSAGTCPSLPGCRPQWSTAPDPATRRQRGYPEPIVDHREAIAAYRAGRHA
jgi:deoxyribodipyrimidine photolyase